MVQILDETISYFYCQASASKGYRYESISVCACVRACARALPNNNIYIYMTWHGFMVFVRIVWWG